MSQQITKQKHRKIFVENTLCPYYFSSVCAKNEYKVREKEKWKNHDYKHNLTNIQYCKTKDKKNVK